MSPTRTRRRRASGNEVVDHLNGMVNNLIKENRQLRRQVEKLSARATGATSKAVEGGLRRIQRRLANALADGATTTRRRSTTTSTSARRTARTRKPVSPEVAEKRRQALAKARAARAAKREAAVAGE